MGDNEEIARQFEDFALVHYSLCECALDDDGDEYEDPDVQYAWEIFEEGYKQARAALAKATGEQ